MLYPLSYEGNSSLILTSRAPLGKTEAFRLHTALAWGRVAGVRKTIGATRYAELLAGGSRLRFR